MIAPGATAPAPGASANELAEDDAAMAALSGDVEADNKKKKKEKKPKRERPPREPGEPIGERLKKALAPVQEAVANRAAAARQAIAGDRRPPSRSLCWW